MNSLESLDATTALLKSLLPPGQDVEKAGAPHKSGQRLYFDTRTAEMTWVNPHNPMRHTTHFGTVMLAVIEKLNALKERLQPVETEEARTQCTAIVDQVYREWLERLTRFRDTNKAWFSCWQRVQPAVILQLFNAFKASSTSLKDQIAKLPLKPKVVPPPAPALALLKKPAAIKPSAEKEAESKQKPAPPPAIKAAAGVAMSQSMLDGVRLKKSGSKFSSQPE